LLSPPTIWQCLWGLAVGVGHWSFPRTALGPKRLLWKGIVKRGALLSPEAHCTRHSVPDAAILSSVDYPPLGVYHAWGSRRGLCIYFLLVPSRWGHAEISDVNLGIVSYMRSEWSKFHQSSTSKWLSLAHPPAVAHLATWSTGRWILGFV
jgi:hypothetical protein